MAFTAPERNVDRVFLHCSASDVPAHDNIETIRSWHVDGNGWSDVGYHFFVRKSGQREAGRPLERTPSAQAGHNTGTIAICLHGLAAERFTTQQFEELIALCDEIDEAYGEGGVTYHGHCEVSSKACPVFDYRRVLGLDENGERSVPSNARPDAIASEPSDTADPILRRSAKGPEVELLQALLVANGADLVVDGLFGQATQSAVRAFQEREGFRVDGVVGPATWAALRGSAGPKDARRKRSRKTTTARRSGTRKSTSKKTGKKKAAKRRSKGRSTRRKVGRRSRA